MSWDPTVGPEVGAATPPGEEPRYIAPEVALARAALVDRLLGVPSEPVPAPEDFEDFPWESLGYDEPQPEPVVPITTRQSVVIPEGSIMLVLSRAPEGYTVIDHPFGLLKVGRTPAEALASWAESAVQMARSTADPVSAAAAALRA